MYTNLKIILYNINMLWVKNCNMGGEIAFDRCTKNTFFTSFLNFKEFKNAKAELKNLFKNDFGLNNLKLDLNILNFGSLSSVMVA